MHSIIDYEIKSIAQKNKYIVKIHMYNKEIIYYITQIGIQKCHTLKNKKRYIVFHTDQQIK